jgi:Fe-S cluster assembly protein SufB
MDCCGGIEEHDDECVDVKVKDSIDEGTVAAAKALESENYSAGFSTDIETEFAPIGLSEDTVRFISAKKEEPEWLLEWRLKAYERWLTMEEPDWAMVRYEPVDYQKTYFYAAPKVGANYASIDDVPQEILDTYKKLGIPLREAEVLLGVEGAAESAAAARETPRVAVDAVFDSVSVATTFRAELEKAGVIFMSISEAVHEHPELVKKYLGTVVPQSDNYVATLNAENTGQFERTLIIADKESYVSYLEGCTAPMRDENQLHAAVVELVALDDAEIKYSTVQNWWPGDENGKGGIYNFVTKRGDCRGDRSKISWTQVETGSAVTWKYPSCVLRGDDSVGEFYSIAVTNGRQMADTGTKMIHLGKRTKSRIISKGISAGKSDNTYRGLVSVNKNAEKARNFTQCDSLLIGQDCGAHTVPYVENRRADAQLEHEATTTKLSDDQLFYVRQRGIGEEEAVALLVNGFVREVLQELPMEFAVEAQSLLKVSLEGSVG